MTHTIPLALLVRAAAALKAVKEVPVNTAIPHRVWADAMYSQSELSHHVDLMLKDQVVEVTAPA